MGKCVAMITVIVMSALLSTTGCSSSSEAGRHERTDTIQRKTGTTVENGPPAQQAERRSVTVDGVTLSILEAGAGDPLIFVHGVVTTSNIFPRYLDAYSPAFRGIAVDLRGYGQSDKPDTGF